MFFGVVVAVGAVVVVNLSEGVELLLQGGRGRARVGAK